MKTNKVVIVFGSAVLLNCGGSVPSSPELLELYYKVLPAFENNGAAPKKDKPPTMILKEEPEPCCNGASCAGPLKYLDEQKYKFMAARKAGCQLNSNLWVSRNWPPICNTQPYEWSDEPHCVAKGTDRSKYVYGKTFVHELMHWVGSQYGVYDPEHKSEWHTVVEQDILRELGYIE